MSNITDLGKVVFVHKGAYDASVAYEAADVVSYNGSSYAVLQACTGVTPAVGAYYALMASKGDKGDTGDDGSNFVIKGTYATIELLNAAVTGGTITPVQGDYYNVGSEAPYNIYMWDTSETPPAFVDQGQLQGPQGPAGTDGADGTNGTDGAPGPNEVTTATATDINGLMMGDGETVKQAVAGTNFALPSADISVALLAASWVGASAPYTQQVAAVGITAADKPVIDIVLSATQTTAEAELADWQKVTKIETGSGIITATCFSEKPENDLNLNVKVVR